MSLTTMALSGVIPVFLVAAYMVNVIKTQPSSSHLSVLAGETKSVDLLGLSLDTSSEHNELGLSLYREECELGLSLYMEECDSHIDELGLSLNMSGEEGSHGLSEYSSMHTEEQVENFHIENVLGTSENIEDTSADSADELGTSIIGNDVGNVIQTIEDALVPLNCSTPKKRTEFGRVFAKTPSRISMDYVAAKVRQGSQMKNKALDLEDIKRSLKNTCSCGRDCFKIVNIKSVSLERYIYWSKPLYLRMYWLIHALRNSETIGRYRILKLEDDKEVCFKAFLKILRINKNTYSLAKSLYGRKALTKQQRKFRSESESTLNVISWLEDYANNYGDRMPHSEDVLLPHKSQKQAMYTRYKSEKNKHSSRIVSRSQFYKIWQTKFPHLKIRQTNPFSKCTTCFALERCEENELMADSLKAIGCTREEHHDRQMCERRYYYAKKEKSRNNPEKFMSIIIDGMDQSKTSLPHFAGRLAKNINAGALLKTHITGVINHGHGGFHTYVDFNQYQHDPNLTLNVIMKALQRAAEKHGDKLPPTLYVQADNCWRENKNRFVFSFLQLLVEKNIFEEVHISFLYVGHTHEDVDQAFSVYSRQLKKTDIETLPDLLVHFENSVLLSNMYDIRSWLLPYIEDLVHISKPLHFKFSKTGEKVLTQYKGQYSSPWINLENNFLKEIPPGKPNILKPFYSRVDVELNVKQITNIKSFFKKTDSADFWIQFYKSLKENNIKAPASEWILEKLPRQPGRKETDIIVALPEHIGNLIRKETDTPTITLKRKPRSKPVANKPRKRMQKKGKPKTGGKKKPGFRENTAWLIPLDAKVKRHIWIKILMDLVVCFVKLFILFFSMLIMVRCLELLVKFLKYLWICLLEDHLGFNVATVSTVLIICCEILQSQVQKLQNLVKGSILSPS